MSNILSFLLHLASAVGIVMLTVVTFACVFHCLCCLLTSADNIDMDGDGPKQSFIIDEDGSLVGGIGGAILPRAEKFSKGSFFGLPFKDTENKAYMETASCCTWQKRG